MPTEIGQQQCTHSTPTDQSDSSLCLYSSTSTDSTKFLVKNKLWGQKVYFDLDEAA